ncbi:radical SAM protein [Marinomonas mediterranea]|uniref:radical SAM protein n=1 Tax=Marinomonas mediterranea TaxID=119864 RepID=UPI00234A0C50|nr:hypothetical protein [Marinomonas mediterranea]WCN14680.1 radical SAM protein [Marinomonas mediterranea]
MDLQDSPYIEITPKTLTIITTYTCNAACEECCFECSPKVKHRLSLAEIVNFIELSIQNYPSLEMVVFTGGECFLLKDDLFAAIKFCTSKGLSTRCVSNGYWGRHMKKAEDICTKLINAGLCEINFSTGLDHMRWVPIESVINACAALVEKNIFTLVTVEKDTTESNCYEEIINNSKITEMIKNKKKFRVQSNSWMAFRTTSEQRGSVEKQQLKSGCDQIYNNLTLTPKREIASCCGLTIEHIPEMRIGDINNVNSFRNEQKDDFLKLWIRVDGPYQILEHVLGREHEALKGIVHACEACAILHQNKEVREKIHSVFENHILNVYHKWRLIETSNKEIYHGS